VALHTRNSGAECGRELIKGLKDVASLLVQACADFFVSDIISGGLLGHLGPLYLALGLKPLDGSISLMFLLETMLQSKSFDTLDGLLGFQVQKL